MDVATNSRIDFEPPKAMYKVFYWKSGSKGFTFHTALFESHLAAKTFVKAWRASGEGCDAELNNWTWMVSVER